MDDIMTLSQQLGQQLSARSASVCTAESCTGGAIAEAITRIPGSSGWFASGYIPYSNQQKIAQLGVPTSLFLRESAVSAAVVEAMVRGACARSQAAFGVAVSGIAGPGGGTLEKPVGTVWLAWQAFENTQSQCFYFSGDRLAVRTQTVAAALRILLKVSA